jgi:hypothetical protein
VIRTAATLLPTSAILSQMIPYLGVWHWPHYSETGVYVFTKEFGYWLKVAGITG